MMGVIKPIHWSTFVLALVLSLTLPAVASAEPAIKIVTPGTGSWIRSPVESITSQSRPLIGVEATGVQPGDRLGCAIDTFPDSMTGPPDACGHGLAGCTATLCGSFQPALPLSADPGEGHTFQAFLVDAGGNVLDSEYFEFAVDPTPPDTAFNHVSANPGGTDPFRPAFSWNVQDQSLTQSSDRSQCSVVPAGKSPRWQRCKTNISGIWRAKLPHKRRHYRFEVRALDQFGRSDSTPVVRDFNPVPCTVKARPVTLGRLLYRGLPVTVRCRFAAALNVRFAYDNSTALENDAIGWKEFTGSKRTSWTRHGKLKVGPKAFVKRQKKLPIRVIGVPGHNIYSPAYGKQTSSTLTLHR